MNMPYNPADVPANRMIVEVESATNCHVMASHELEPPEELVRSLENVVDDSVLPVADNRIDTVGGIGPGLGIIENDT
jgi:hypothetical protein